MLLGYLGSGRKDVARLRPTLASAGHGAEFGHASSEEEQAGHKDKVSNQPRADDGHEYQHLRTPSTESVGAEGYQIVTSAAARAA
jgi:hypothetical protein